MVLDICCCTAFNYILKLYATIKPKGDPFRNISLSLDYINFQSLKLHDKLNKIFSYLLDLYIKESFFML